MVISTDDLPLEPLDGQIETLRIVDGSGSAIYVELEYIEERSKWVGREELMVGGLDQTGHILEAGVPLTTKQYTPFFNHPLYSWDYLAWRKCDQLHDAGLRFEYRHAAWLKGSGAAKMNVGCYFYSYDLGQWNSPDGLPGGYTTPPTGGFGETTYMSGGVAGSSGVGGTSRQYVESDWQPLISISGAGAARPPRDVIYPAIYGYMDVGAVQSGLIIGYQLWLRWVADPPTESPPPEDWMAIVPGDVDWIEITDIRNGWSALPSPFEPFACAFVGPFLVFKGGVTGPTVPSDTVLFALPEGAVASPGSVRRLLPDTGGDGTQGAVNLTDIGTVVQITGGGDNYYVFDDVVLPLTV